MPEVFVTIYDVWVFTGFIILALIGILTPIILWKRWVKREKAEDKKYGINYHSYDFKDWWNLDNNLFIGLPCLAVTLFAALVILMAGINGATTIVKNQINEPIYYNSMVAKGKTLEQAINVSDDLINTDLYTSAVTYNESLAQIQALSKNPMYVLNFTGNYDWDAIEYIELK